MSISDSDIAFMEELFAPLGAIIHRKMMGGLSLYCDGQIFSILDSSGSVFLKAKGEFAEKLAAAGSHQFGAQSGKTMGYWTLPDDGLDDPEAASDWARKALANL